MMKNMLASAGRRRSSGYAQSRVALGTRLFVGLLLFFVVDLCFFGGSSRYDQLAQLPVRLMAILVIAAASWRPTATVPAAIRVPALLLGATVFLVILHLIPLPPEIWASLPGRSVFAEAAAAAGFPQPWRPVALVPDLAINTLLALLVPAAVLYGLAVLEPRYWRWITPTLLAILLVSLLIGLVQLATGGGALSVIYKMQRASDTASGIFTNRNHQALLLAIGLPLLAGWEVIRRSDAVGAAARWTGAALTVLVLIVLVATGSRAGVFLGGLGLSGGVAVIWSVRRHGPAATPRRSAILSLAGIMAIAALLCAAIFLGRGQAIDRLFTADPLADKRARALPTVIDMTLSYFPVGSGFGSFDAAFRQAEPFGLLEITYFNQAHNDLIQLLLEGGLPALFLLLAALGWLAGAATRLWRSTSTRGAVVRGRAATLAFVLMFVASALDYPLRTPIMMAIASALMVQIAAALDEIRAARQRPALQGEGGELALPHT